MACGGRVGDQERGGCEGDQEERVACHSARQTSCDRPPWQKCQPMTVRKRMSVTG